MFTLSRIIRAWAKPTIHLVQLEDPTNINPSPLTNRDKGVLGDLLANLKFAGEAILQRPNAERFYASLNQLALLCVLLWSLSALDDYLDANFSSHFSVWGIVSDAALNYFWIMALAIVTLMVRNSAYFLPLAVGTAAVSVVLSLLWMPLTLLWETHWPVSYRQHLSTAWWFLFALEIAAFFRLLSWYCPLAAGHRFALSLVYGGIILFSVWYFPPQSMFYEPWSEETVETRVNVEDTYYAQANLMRQAVHQLTPENPGTADVYHIGFAAYGEQDVFLHEVESALAILSEKFSSTGKTLSLINNPKTVLNQPLATRHNLHEGVQSIAKLMNLDEDLMLVFLSSHGSEDGEIAVELGDLNLSDLSATTLREILDEHHVYWRIIIISACFSGSFIEELKSPSTLIITAAAADKSSFGCEHQREWTYFGEAFFGDALASKGTLIESFNTAKTLVTEREQAEGKEPSEPQIWVGEAIKAYLTLHAL